VLAFVRTRNFPLGDLQREQDQRLLLSGDLAADKPVPKSLLTGTSLEGTA
jgi:anionic cell wall polymer biosynthesis LytR-Cps2A-Psr (LCP) family protein